MKLDDRIIDRKYIFDCFSADKAKEYIGEDCYLTDDLPQFEDLDFIPVYKLDAIDNNSFYSEMGEGNFEYCLPVRFVKPVEKEKEYKPFDHVTFEQHYGVGSMIIYRKKGEEYRMYKAMVTSTTSDYITNTFYVVLGKSTHTLNDLFKEYEICENGEWKPFGVKEE